MTRATRPTRAAAPAPRWSLVVACVAHAALLAWGAAALPWRSGAVFVAGAYALAAGHVLTAVLAATRAPLLAPVWRALATASLACLAGCAWQVIASAAYLAELYGGLGRGVAAALALALSPVALVTLPFGLWGVAAAGGRGPGRASALIAAVVAAAAAAATGHAVARAAFETLAPAPADAGALAAALAPQLSAGRALPAAAEAAPGLDRSGAAHCGRPPLGSDGYATVAVRYLAATPEGVATRNRCLQQEPDALPRRIAELLRNEALRGPVKIDWVIAARPLVAGPPALAALELQPGVDGVCLEGACLMPWQLVLGDCFTALRPLAFVPDLRFGFDPAAVRAALGAPPGAGVRGLTAIRVLSVTLDRSGALHPLVRLRARPPPLDAGALTRAARRAERHVTASQQRGGAFEYMRDVATGAVISRSISVQRQAGTALVLCELGSDREAVRRVAARALAKLSRWELRRGDVSGLTRDRSALQAGLGEAALPLVAFLECRRAVGPGFDPLIGRLGRLLLALQRPDGGFHPRFDFDAGRAVPGPAELYADGQAVYALSLLERHLGATGDVGALPPLGAVRAAVERAMDFFAGRYWDHPLGDAFFLEENWHCLAARASLGHHRNDAYERFCLDYTAFRSGLVLDGDSGVAPDFVGGFGFGNLIPPQTVPTAGFGETLAAAMAIKRARGEDLRADRKLLEQTLRFLLRQQWDEASCFACAQPDRVVGGFSESAASPTLRIDFTQHAWAAIGHGARALGWQPGDG